MIDPTITQAIISEIFRDKYDRSPYKEEATSYEGKWYIWTGREWVRLHE